MLFVMINIFMNDTIRPNVKSSCELCVVQQVYMFRDLYTDSSQPDCKV